MIAYGYKKIVAVSREIISSLNENGVPTIWLPMAMDLNLKPFFRLLFGTWMFSICAFGIFCL